MLHAIEKNKSTRAKQYEGFFRELLSKSENTDNTSKGNTSKAVKKRKLQSEDEITSTVLGPLEFLDPKSVYDFLCKLTETTPIFDCDCDLFDFTLWPKREHIEPDGQIVFSDKNLRHIFLLELKWNADLSGESQLSDQWEKYLTPDEREHSTHVFIAKHIGEALEQDQSLWNGQLKPVTWLQFRRQLGLAFQAESPYLKPMKRWAKLADQFLEKSGIFAFQGFCQISEPSGLSSNSSNIFWRPFSGWNRLELPAEIPNISSPIFFSKQE